MVGRCRAGAVARSAVRGGGPKEGGAEAGIDPAETDRKDLQRAEKLSGKGGAR